MGLPQIICWFPSIVYIYKLKQLFQAGILRIVFLFLVSGSVFALECDHRPPRSIAESCLPWPNVHELIPWERRLNEFEGCFGQGLP